MFKSTMKHNITLCHRHHVDCGVVTGDDGRRALRWCGA